MRPGQMGCYDLIFPIGRPEDPAVQRSLYVDASQGASGDMILGCLVDLGVPLEALRAAVRELPIRGWSLDSRQIVRCSLTATMALVDVEDTGPHRGWADLQKLLMTGSLAPRVRDRALRIFRRLIEAEAEAHGQTPDAVHLHEAGGTDAIVDVVGACAGLEHLDVGEIVVSPMTMGFGEVRCAHGVYPVPAPATTLLVRGAPVRGGSIEAERLTPTGAAILTTLADRWGSLPAMRPRAVGYGAGHRELGESPNMLRMILGDVDPESTGLGGVGREIAVLECTLDDATPQALAFAARRLLECGALDVFTSPVTMKKGRQGHHLTVLARPDDVSRLARQVLRDTPTLGLRYRFENRFELERSVCTVDTSYGAVSVKVGTLNGRVLHVWPEYDSCAALAERDSVSLWQVQQAALDAYASRKDSKKPKGETT